MSAEDTFEVGQRVLINWDDRSLPYPLGGYTRGEGVVTEIRPVMLGDNTLGVNYVVEHDAPTIESDYPPDKEEGAKGLYFPDFLTAIEE